MTSMAVVRSTTYLSYLLSLSLIVAGCANPLPYQIVNSTQQTEATDREPKGTPLLKMRPHSDGLGWTFFASQPTLQKQQTIRTEEWKAWNLVHKSYNPLSMGLGLITCTLSVPLGLFLAGTIPSEQFFEYPLKGCTPIAGYRWQNIDQLTTIPLEDGPPTTIQLPLQDGLLTEIWTFPSGAQESFPHLLTSDQAEHGYPIRLTKLANNRSPEAPTLRLTLQNPQGKTEDTDIFIPPQQWAMAQRMTPKIPSSTAWPAPVRLRIDSTDPGIIPPITRHLTSAGLPVTIRTAHRTETEREQVATYRGMYETPTTTTPGQWTGANVHIFIELTSGQNGTSALMTITNIETGLLIATLATMPAPETLALIDPITGDLLHLLHDHAS